MPLRDEDVSVTADDDVIRLVQFVRLGRFIPLARLSLRSQREQDLSLRIQFDDVMRPDIGRPDVAFVIDAQTVRPHKETLAKTPDKLAVGIELH